MIILEARGGDAAQKKRGLLHFRATDPYDKILRYQISGITISISLPAAWDLEIPSRIAWL